MKKIIVTVAVSLVIGFAAASWLEKDFSSRDRGKQATAMPERRMFDATASAEERISALEEAIMEERRARQMLEDELLFLTRELERLDAAAVESEEQEESARAQMREAFRARRFGFDEPGSEEGRINKLIDAGFSAERAEWIVRRESQLQMEMLQARYEAMRNSEDPRFFGLRSSSNDGLRAELGDADYEKYLEANGRPTAVHVGSVLPNSPAQQAGLQPGDRIIRYDGERVFSMFDVAGRIMDGDAGGNVVVDIERDGAPMQLVLPRGPLGVAGN